MVNISSSNFTNIANNSINIGKEGETRNALYEVNCIITVIINSITCPLTVLLNVLVIMAVKRRPRLQSNTNILLACLATTDLFTGLVVQPSFIVWKIYVELLDFISWNTSPPEEDQNSTAAPRGSGTIRQRKQGTQDNCVCSWCCYAVLCTSGFIHRVIGCGTVPSLSLSILNVGRHVFNVKLNS